MIPSPSISSVLGKIIKQTSKARFFHIAWISFVGFVSFLLSRTEHMDLFFNSSNFPTTIWVFFFNHPDVMTWSPLYLIFLTLPFGLLWYKNRKARNLPPVEKKATKIGKQEIPQHNNNLNESIGVAFSGGGIRSFNFCLGAAKHLLEEGILHKARALSSVSGGGYMLTSVAAWALRRRTITKNIFDEDDFRRGIESLEKQMKKNSNFVFKNAYFDTILAFTTAVSAIGTIVLIYCFFLSLLVTRFSGVPIMEVADEEDILLGIKRHFNSIIYLTAMFIATPIVLYFCLFGFFGKHFISKLVQFQLESKWANIGFDIAVFLLGSVVGYFIMTFFAIVNLRTKTYSEFFFLITWIGAQAFSGLLGGEEGISSIMRPLKMITTNLGKLTLVLMPLAISSTFVISQLEFICEQSAGHVVISHLQSNSLYENAIFALDSAEHQTYKNLQFINSTFANTTFTGTNFLNVSFVNPIFANSTFVNATFINTTFTGVQTVTSFILPRFDKCYSGFNENQVWHFFPVEPNIVILIAIALLIITLIFYENITKTMFYFYKEKIRIAFYPNDDPDSLQMKHLPSRPELIINTTANNPSEDVDLTSFAFTPTKAGGEVLGETEELSSTPLSEAMAISGSAVAMDMGLTKSSPTEGKKLLWILGIYLGDWIRTPKSFKRNFTSTIHIYKGITWFLMISPMLFFLFLQAIYFVLDMFPLPSVPEDKFIKLILFCISYAGSLLRRISVDLTLLSTILVPVFILSLGEVSKEAKMMYWATPLRHIAQILGIKSGDMDLVLLTDGGHYENLGVFELLRRKCNVIYSFDASEDPEWLLEDLRRLTYLCSKDRAIIEKRKWFCLFDFELSKSEEKSSQGFSQITNHSNLQQTKERVIKIHYKIFDYDLNEDKSTLSTTGVMWFVKATMVGDEPEDIQLYAIQNKEFPHHNTMDLWFDAQTSEAYQKLGKHSALKMLEIANKSSN